MFLRAVAASIAFILVGLAIVSVRDARGTVTVAVPKKDVPQYAKIERQDVEEKELSRAAAQGGIRKTGTLAGKTALVALAKDKPVRAADVSSLDAGTLARRQRLGIPLTEHVSLSDEFKAGDFVDVLLSPSGDVPANGVVIRRVPVLSKSGGPGKALFVAMTPDELKEFATYSGRSSVSVVRSA